MTWVWPRMHRPWYSRRVNPCPPWTYYRLRNCNPGLRGCCGILFPRFPSVFECFLTTPGVTQNKAVWLTTNNFGNDFVRVQRLILLCEGAVKTGPTSVRFPLSGAQEVPPAATTASGDCTWVLSADQSSFQVDCIHDVAGATAAHIHLGATGVAGPIIVSLGSPSSPINFTWDASSSPPRTAADVADLLAGDLYVNVHSDDFPGGEIRGQIPLRDPRGFWQP